ncbi:MAG: hypothetical protein KC931_12660 [Candidatus Omnitrophica bacterium]|nr:hypothetical protein [Candidatus Omnitrophota bacterium]
MPERITGTEVRYRMSRCANNQMAFDSEETLHITYWSGGLSTLPSSPSHIYHRSWRFGEGWSAQTPIDDSTAESSHLGGRHPSLTVDTRDTVWVTWHDHRNSTSAGNWIDNLEIYADSKPRGGSFSANDLRITNTNAAQLGDNGYTPKMAALADGRVSIAWDDFGLDGNIADLFLKTSDPAGLFDLGKTLTEMRITNKDDRGGNGSYSVPDLAVDQDGHHHLCWISGLGAAADLFYAEAIEGGTTVTEVPLKASAADFFDPPHITVSDQGDVWIAYGDEELQGIGNEDVVLFRRRAGQSSFDPAIPLLTDPAREYAPDIEIDSRGFVHLVWVDERAGTNIYYALFEPENLTLLTEVNLTQTDGNWARPSLVLDDRDQAYILWEEQIGLNSGAIWFATNATEKASGVASWDLYE